MRKSFVVIGESKFSWKRRTKVSQVCVIGGDKKTRNLADAIETPAQASATHSSERWNEASRQHNFLSTTKNLLLAYCVLFCVAPDNHYQSPTVLHYKTSVYSNPFRFCETTNRALNLDESIYVNSMRRSTRSEANFLLSPGAKELFSMNSMKVSMT